MGGDVEENPCGTRVFKTWVSLLRLEFCFFFMQIWPNVLLLPRVQSKLQRSSSILRLFVRSFLCSSAFFVSSSRLFVLPRCWRPNRLLRRCILLQVLFFFKFNKNRVSKTWLCFLELESYRLEIYVAKFVHGSSRTRVWKLRFSSSISSF